MVRDDLGQAGYDPAWKGAGADATYLMIKSIEIDNFRCFRHLEINGLKRVNVIVGPNGSGKTAFLESLFLASGGSPELALRLRNFRGMGTSVEVPVAEGLEAIWKNLFYQFDQSKPVVIDLKATDLKSRRVTVSMGEAELMNLPLEPIKGFRPSPRQQQAVTSAVEFAWRDAGGNVFRSRPTVNDDKLQFPQAKSANKIVFVPSNFRLSPEEAAKRLSVLSRKGAARDLVEVLGTVYPDVEDISVENSDGNWEVFVKVKHLQERIPMALHSSGASRLIAMMLAITAVPGGVVLIDEVENGFYFKKLPEIWRVVLGLAEQFECQVFISTHSNECLRAMDSVLAEHSDSFTLMNIESVEGTARVTVSPGEVMAAALKSGFEVR